MRPVWRGPMDARGPWMCRMFAVVNTLVLLSSEDKCLEWMAGLKGMCILNVHSYYQIAL